jgi:RHS repeat-associated protein
MGNIKTWHRKLGADATDQTYNLGYDDADQLTDAVLSEDANPNNVLYQYHARFDYAGNRTSAQENNVLSNYVSNNLNEINSSGGGGTFVVVGHTDEAAKVSVNGMQAKLKSGNRFEAEVPVSVGTNQLSITATDFASTPNSQTKKWSVDVGSPSPTAFTYDTNGNLVSSGTSTFFWDAENRLVKIVSQNETRVFRYDGNGRRVEETDSTGSVRARWVWCDLAPCEYRNNTSTQRLFSFGATYGASSQFYSYDQLGSLREVSAPDGSLLKRWDYSLTGQRNRLRDSGGFEPQSSFAGLQPLDEGLLVAAFRAYQPTAARWLSRDPIGEPGGTHLYAYVSNRMATNTDVLGLTGEKCCSREEANRRMKLRGDLQLQIANAQLAAVDLNRQILELDRESFVDASLDFAQCLQDPTSCYPFDLTDHLREFRDKSNVLCGRLKSVWDGIHSLQILLHQIEECAPPPQRDNSLP